MSLSNKPHLLDVNVLIALANETHIHHQTVMRWFDSPNLDWGVCAFTEAGFLRLSTNPVVGLRTLDQATAVLSALVLHPGYRYWPITAAWASLIAPFRARVFGHQQITDALLLGMAIHGDGVLVTMDKAIEHMAGARLSKHVLVLKLA